MIVSVVIPVYNREASLGACLDSVLNQTFKEFEIIVVDDGSTDSSIDVVKSMEDKRIRLVCHEKNLGAAATRNTGVNHASGDFIAFLDSDDRWMPDKFEYQLAFMRRTGYLVSTTAYRRVFTDGLVMDSPQSAECQKIENFAWGCCVSPGSTLIVSRDVWQKVGGLDVEFPRMEDWDWVIRLALAGYELGVCPGILAEIEFTSHPNADAVRLGLSRMTQKHYQALKHAGHESAFRATLAVEYAAQAYRDGRPFVAVLQILLSLYRHPIGNQAVNRTVILRVFRFIKLLNFN